MTLLDYGNINYYFSNNQINPFEEQLKQESVYYDCVDFPSEAELLCIDPNPPPLLDFDVASLFDPHPPPTPPLELDYHHSGFDVDELLIVPEELHYYPCIDDFPPPLHLPAEENYSFEEGFSDQFLPFPKKKKLSSPLFNGFIPELHGVSQCGVFSNGVTVGDNYSNCQQYAQNNNVGGVGEFYGDSAKFSGGCGVGKVKEVSVQSRAARERRRKITGKTQELGKLVPGGTKLNTAEMFQAAYKYVKFMQAQLGVLNSIKSLYEEWIKIYSRRRYGKAIQQLETAWGILYHTIYNCTDGIADHNKDYIVEFPDLDPVSLLTVDVAREHEDNHMILRRSLRGLSLELKSSLPQPHLWYPTEEVIKALSLFLDAGKYLAESLTFRYDLVDLTRQALSKLANDVYLKAVAAFQQRDLKAFNLQSQKFIQLIKDIDELLATDDNFLLGTWLESAKSLASKPTEMKQYEWNARTQITMWFDTTPTNQSKLHDYANKFWSGLLQDYYLPRASTYFDHLRKALSMNDTFKMDGWRKEWISYSNEWQTATKLYPVKAQGDALSVATTLYEKYFSKALV